MVLDTSAILAILFEEPEARDFAQQIAADRRRLVSSVSMLEASIVLSARKGDKGVHELDALLDTIGVTIVSFDEKQTRLARDAFARFGKGRHPAGLNFGDCCSYALAIMSSEPLLFKGNDFSRTDLAAESPS